MSESRGWWSRELSWMVLLYLAFGLFYMVVLRLSFPQGYRAPEGLFEYFNFRILYLDYPLKALYTLPIWYLTFRVLRHWPLSYRVAFNLALLPAWVKGWQLSYYWLVDNLFSGGHLQGPGEWWDIYIPALFYILQFGVFHAWHYYQDLRRTEVARAESERLALTSELSALKAQLNPHFLYNAFNTISASTGPGQERTRDMIAQLSDLFRYQLRANREWVLPLADELDFVTDYLALEKERFGDRLDYRVDVEQEELLSAEVAPLLLQPLVENAVRHGLSPLLEGGTVTIAASTTGDQLSLTVADTGTGFDPERIMVPRAGKYIALPVEEILCIRAEGDYSTIVTAESSFLSQYSLKETEARLDPGRFLRIRRSTIIHRAAIREIYREGHGYDVVLVNGELLRASRGYADTVRDILF